MSPIYLLWDSSCKLIIYCGTHPPELIKYRPISHRGHGKRETKEVCDPSPSQVNTGAGARLSSQDGISQHQETVSLSLPQLNRLIETSFLCVG
jgi:hypothetical protein